MRIVDLTMAVAFDHFRWSAGREVRGDFQRGDLYQATTVRLPCHGFTHVDAPAHMIPGGATIEATPLERVIGRCAVADLGDVTAMEAIGPEKLAARLSHRQTGEFVLLATGWDRQRAPCQREYWTEGPYLTRTAAEWLLAQGVTTIAYDFCQDFAVRQFLDGGAMPPISEHVTHDVLLRNGVTMIEYLANCAALARRHVLLSAAPIKLPGADGAPARAYAIEDSCEDSRENS
jgi:arylformamidase